MDPKLNKYGEFFAAILSFSVGAELILLTLGYFVNNSINPFQVLNHASLQSVVIFSAVLVISGIIVIPALRLMKKNAGKHEGQTWKTESFSAFMKDSRLWVIIPFFFGVFWFLNKEVIESASNLPSGSLFLKVFNLTMAIFMGFGGIMILFGMRIMVRNSRWLHK